MIWCLHRVVAGLNIGSFVFTDSGTSCDGPSNGNVVTNIKQAFNNVGTAYPKYFWSKQDMSYNHYLQTGTCTTYGGHTREPMNTVMGARWYNVICNGNTQDTTYRATVPACFDLGDNVNRDNRCFRTGPDGWFETIYDVCLVNYKTIQNAAPPCALAVSANQEHKQKRKVCKLQHAYSSDTELQGVKTFSGRMHKVGDARDLRSFF
jgi:hypothetical protein